MPPYKRQITAGDIPQVKPFDTARMLNSVARTGEAIGQATAQLARQNFQNHFEIESRKLLQESYERNRNNPRQLLAEQQKIRVNLLKALPDRQQRGEAAVRFEVQAAPYMQRAKENLYKQTFEEAQTSTFEKMDLTLNNMRENAASLYSPNLASAGASIEAFGFDILGLEELTALRDERGEAYLSPQQQAMAKEQIRRIMTEGAARYFDSLQPVEMQQFYEEYKNKTVLLNRADNANPSGFGTMTMTSENTDWPTYEKNLRYMEKVIGALQEETQKGWDLQQSQIYAMEKAKEMVGLQMRLEEFKRMEEAGEEIPAFSVFSQMQLLNDLATKPFQQGPDGRVSYILDPAKGEYYEEVKKLIPYMSRVIDDIRRDDAKSKSNFGYGLGLVSRMVEQDGTLNDRDISDMLKMYYDNMMKEFNNDSMALLSPRDIGGNQKMLKAFRDASITFYGRRGQTLPDGINFYSVPGSMGVRVYNGDVLHLPEKSYAQGTGAFVQSQKAHFQNPYVYAMGTGQYNARREEK
ncbi:MAG TPA: hypothetical protein IAB21_03295 [Candidatus Avelusimicrobium excrementipullorum]|nr:hypothetical protein [Candidatus Avelusimicrobium excrementipullorum]